MNEPKWLSSEDVIDLQATAIEKDGGLEGGLVHPDYLDSALARPQNEFAYTGQDDVFMLAATYAEGIAKSHAFADANKRTAFLATALFLLDNGFRFQRVEGTEHADMMVGLTKDQVSREDMRQYLAFHSVEIAQDMEAIRREAEAHLARERSQGQGYDQGEDV